LLVVDTMTLTDLVTDLTAAHLPFLGGEAHEGMATAAHALYSSALRGPGGDLLGDDGSSAAGGDAATSPRRSANGSAAGSVHEGGRKSMPAEVLEQTKATLQEQGSLALDFWLRDVYPGYGLAITGHSLGGGVAILFTMLLVHHRSRMLRDSHVDRRHVPFADVDVHCVAFGSPPVFAPLSAVSDEANQCIQCIVHEDDAVPRLSLLTVRELLQLLRKVSDADPTFVQELLRKEANSPEIGGSASTNTGDDDDDGAMKASSTRKMHRPVATAGSLVSAKEAELALASNSTISPGRYARVTSDGSGLSINDDDNAEMFASWVVFDRAQMAIEAAIWVEQAK